MALIDIYFKQHAELLAIVGSIAQKLTTKDIESDLSDHYGIEAFVHFDIPSHLALSLLNRDTEKQSLEH